MTWNSVGESKELGVLFSKISTVQSAKNPDGSSNKQELQMFLVGISVCWHGVTYAGLFCFLKLPILSSFILLSPTCKHCCDSMT